MFHQNDGVNQQKRVHEIQKIGDSTQKKKQREWLGGEGHPGKNSYD